MLVEDMGQYLLLVQLQPSEAQLTRIKTYCTYKLTVIPFISIPNYVKNAI